MRFSPYSETVSVPNVIVDGAANKSTLLTLSHWPKSGTPAELKADTSATEAELIEHCRGGLAHYKCPTSVEFRTELARTATGKLQKFKLRAPFWEGRERKVN